MQHIEVEFVAMHHYSGRAQASAPSCRMPRVTHQPLALTQRVQGLVCLPCRLKQPAQLQQAAQVGRGQSPPARPCSADRGSPRGVAAGIEQHCQQAVCLGSVEEHGHHVASSGARLSCLRMQR